MSIRSYIFILSIIFLTSGTSSLLLLLYMNPVPNPNLAFLLLGTALFLSSTSFLAPFIFFLKKIYYRGDVNILTMNASLRQAILLTSAGIFIATLSLLQIRDNTIIFTALTTAACIEVMFQALE